MPEKKKVKRRGTYRNVHLAAISPIEGVKIQPGETIKITAEQARVCGKWLKRV